MSSRGPSLSLGCDRIPLAALSSVRGKGGSQGPGQEEATAVDQLSDDCSDE